MKIINIYEPSSFKQKLMHREPVKDKTKLEAYVKGIIKEVQTKGDTALIKFARKFDKVSLDSKSLMVSREEISEAYEKVTEDQISTIKAVKERLEAVEKQVLERLNMEIKLDGICIKFCTRPIQRVGCYVPGGKAAYPSTLLMTVIPALVAGVPNIAVCSPPNRNGLLNPLTLVAADICGVNEIYKVGGPQAIAAMAYGTETVKPVDKIVGPGNIYVAIAKRLVSRNVAIDFPAGPSELLVLADENANPRFVALDMCAQAEHGPDSTVGLITTSRKLAEKTISELEDIAKSTPRSSIVTEALSNNGFVVVCDTVDEMVDLANAFAPEHVEVMLKNPEDAVKRLNAAGIVLVGQYTPASLSDYYGGTNHVLPTGGVGRIFSGLSSLDFVKRIAIVKGSRKGLSKAYEYIRILSKAEGLPAHFRAVEERMKN
ncbi:MAG: histidinol dehydrogenase [Candidatus Bathyarchaeia archaeon]